LQNPSWAALINAMLENFWGMVGEEANKHTKPKKKNPTS
jgi:hypothetical protein